MPIIDKDVDSAESYDGPVDKFYKVRSDVTSHFTAIAFPPSATILAATFRAFSCHPIMAPAAARISPTFANAVAAACDYRTFPERIEQITQTHNCVIYVVLMSH